MMAEHSSVLQQPSNISFLLQYLGGYSQLDEAVVGVGNGLKEVGNGVGGHAVVLQAQGLQGGVLVHYRAQCRHSKVIYLKREKNVFKLNLPHI